jgi:O-acetyl-ADP-ribose deacetylase (regulator of RNase III)
MNRVLQEYTIISDLLLQIVLGDLTQEEVDAIVNAANAHLMHGGGLAGAIIRHGGNQIQTESTEWVKKFGPVSHEDPAITSGGNLLCSYIIHAVGPVWGSGQEETKLAAAVRGSLRVADKLGLDSIAIPAISTGIFGYPIYLAAGVILETIIEYGNNTPSSRLKLIRLTLLDQSTANVFLEIFNTLYPHANNQSAYN